MFFGKDNLFTYYDFYYDVRLIQKMKNLLRLDSPRSLFLHCVFFPSYPPNFISHYFRTGTKSRTGMTLFFYIHILHVFLIIEDLKWRFFFMWLYLYSYNNNNINNNNNNDNKSDFKTQSYDNRSKSTGGKSMHFMWQVNISFVATQWQTGGITVHETTELFVELMFTPLGM